LREHDRKTVGIITGNGYG